MLVSLEKKILFFHISKTAGTAIHSLLSNLCPDHQSSFDRVFTDNLEHRTIRPLLKKWRIWKEEKNFTHITQADARQFFKISHIDPSDFFEFIVVRNPYERFKSQIIYTHLSSQFSVDYLLDEFNELRDARSGYWFNSQLEYVNNSLTKNLKIYKFEELHKLWNDLSERYNYGDPLKVEYINKTEDKEKYLINLTYKQKRRIYDLCKDEFDFFGYDKEFSFSSSAL